MTTKLIGNPALLNSLIRFEELVLAILNHYNSLPETAGGAYAPIHYWISAFAVNKVSQRF
jgi:hypothetical protein